MNFGSVQETFESVQDAPARKNARILADFESVQEAFGSVQEAPLSLYKTRPRVKMHGF